MKRPSLPSLVIVLSTALLMLLFGRFAIKADETTPLAPLMSPAPVIPVSTSPPAVLLDNLVMGNDRSEQQHELKAEKSQTGNGAFGLPFRRLLPAGGEPWEGGKIFFTMKVDPQEQNYVTVRLWGSDLDENMLILYAEGKQVGYRHNGDVDLVANADEEPRFPGRFYYTTTPLPREMTAGKSEIHLEIWATGPIYAYAGTFATYQKPMTKPSREIYRIYTHTDGCFIPPADEKQGEEPPLKVRAMPGPEVMDELKSRINDNVNLILSSTKPVDQMHLQFLAKCYYVKGNPAYNSQTAVDQTVKGVDAYYVRWKADPKDVLNDKATWNPSWFAVGPAGDAVRLLVRQIEPRLEEKTDGNLTRRDAWSKMFQDSREHLRMNRKWLTNQAMFSDVNIYRSNRALEAIDPAIAMPEDKALRYLYEAAGLQPWLGSDTPDGSSSKPFGTGFLQVTPKGLTRELGYSGDYGEGGAEGAMEIYESTRVPGGEGDPRLREQVIKMYRARGYFRYPSVDSEGNRTMRLETVVGWRDFHYPGRSVYVQRSTNIIDPVAATLDPYLVGWAQQMFDDNQFFAIIDDMLKRNRFRDTVGITGLATAYDIVKAQPANPNRLPMTPGQPDFAWADETDGVVAIKHGDEILYASLYWRAGSGINSLARTHYLTPQWQQIAVVHEDVQFDDSGKTYTRKNWVNFGFGNGGPKYPDDEQQALAGEVLPVAKAPPDLDIQSDEPNRFAGMGQFYTLRFGPYLIGMNTSTNKTFDFQVPRDAKSVSDLVSKRHDLKPGSIEKIGPQSTVVFYLIN